MSIRTLCAAVIAVACAAGVASAQDQGPSVSGNVSAFNMDSNTSIAYTGAFDYRFNRVVGLELELTWVPTLNSDLTALASAQDLSSSLTPILGPIQIPLPRISNAGGRAVILSNNVRLAIPTTTTRVEPFFVAGGGIASIRKTADLTYTFPPILGIVAPGLPRTTVQPLSSTSLGLALTIGGGVGFRVTPHLWVDADLRLVRILADEDQNAGRFGVAARYRF